MTKLAGNLRRGATQHLTASWNASDALRRIADLGITTVGGVPTQLALMLRDREFQSYDLSRLRAIVIGGGPATPALVREARMRFGVPLAVRFSCNEAGIGTGTLLSDPEEDAELTVGRPQPGVALRNVAAEGNALPRGEVGEVVLDSPAVMDGYWRAPPHSPPEVGCAPAILAGWTTGDGSVWPGAPSSDSSGAATTSTRWRSKAFWPTIRAWRRWPS
jgi:acyl-CoA synthetase (AMP-forming)/AMP-acid ligase II